MRGVDLSFSHLIGCRFSGADLRGVDFTGADMLVSTAQEIRGSVGGIDAIGCPHFEYSSEALDEVTRVGWDESRAGEP